MLGALSPAPPLCCYCLDLLSLDRTVPIFAVANYAVWVSPSYAIEPEATFYWL